MPARESKFFAKTAWSATRTEANLPANAAPNALRLAEHIRSLLCSSSVRWVRLRDREALRTSASKALA